MTEPGRAGIGSPQVFALWGIGRSSGVLASTLPGFAVCLVGRHEQSDTEEGAKCLEGFCKAHLTALLANASWATHLAFPGGSSARDSKSNSLRPSLEVDHSGVTSSF